jgi:hypothetical protein
VRVLIDSDPLVYLVGFAVQETWYELHWADVNPEAPDDPDADRDHIVRMRPKWRVDEFVRLLNLSPEEITIRPYVVAEPKAHALHVMKEQLEKIIRAVKGALADYPEFRGRPIEHELYLSGSTNFRNVVEYKGNRDRDHRPEHYAALRNYLVEQWGAKLCEGYEADDAVAMEQAQAGDEYDVNTIIATIDKDLKMVPGWHYNTRTAEDYIITRDEALLMFYRQLLTGDATDNIPGLYRIGDKKAEKMLPKVLPEQEMYAVVLAAYEENLAKFGDDPQARERNFGAHTSPEAMLLENARLLYMQQRPDELWNPPGIPNGSVKEAGFIDGGNDEF